ncbi:hypothetical protein [Streptomyces sp. NPDC056144]|uniref:hypothetical protein n=1 Tax=unclassified Streptomyces TaxID=2593676 RepID=UPI0035DF6107
MRRQTEESGATTMRRAMIQLVTGCAAVLSVTSCAMSESPAGEPSPTSGRARVSATVTPGPSAIEPTSKEQAVAWAADRMNAAASGANSPAGPGLLVAADSDKGALFVWETADGRSCHGVAFMPGTTTVACSSRPDPPSAEGEPRLVPLVRMMATGWNVVFGAERETVESVTCNGRRLQVRDVGVTANGRRTVHAIEFPDLTVGEVSVRVRRGTRVVTEYLELEKFEKAGGQDLPSCGPVDR